MLDPKPISSFNAFRCEYEAGQLANHKAINFRNNLSRKKNENLIVLGKIPSNQITQTLIPTTEPPYWYLVELSDSKSNDV